nr:reverse transcriptase domain-containing protein [Tanacetum cinerariifolium]
MTPINDIGNFGNAYDDEAVEEEVDMNNVDSSYTIHDAPLTKFLKDHPKEQVISSIETPVQTKQMTKKNEEHAQMDFKKPVQALKDPSWVEAMQDELLQFKLLNVWTLVDLQKDKWAIGTKWVFKNKKDERAIVIKNKARLVAQGHTQEEGIGYDEVFTPVARIEDIRLFLAYASFKDFVVQQMYVKSAFLYGKIEEEVYICQPLGFEDPDFPDKVYKTLHLQAVKRKFRYLKGQPKLGLWYPRDSPFDLEAYSDSDYAGASFDRKFTTGGCQFLGKRMMIAKDGRCFMDIFAFKSSNSSLNTVRQRMERDAGTAFSLEAEQDSGEPSSFFDFEEVMNNNHNQEPPPHNGPPPMVRPNGQAPQTMEELCQPSINGWGGPIAPILIQAPDFGLRHRMIQQVQNTCQFHGLPGHDANRYIDKFLEITQHMKQNGVSGDALRLSHFPYSLTHHAIAWYDRLPRNSIHSFDDMMRKFLSKCFPPSMVTKLRNEIMKFEQKPHESLFEVWERSGGTFMQKTPKEFYELIENMTTHHIHWDTSAIRDETSRNISSTSTTESLEVVRQLEMMNKNFLEMMRQIQMVKTVDTLGSLPSNTVPNPRADLKAITTQSGVTLAGPSVSSPSKEVDREPKMITDQVLTKSTNNVPPLVVQPSPASTSTSSTPISSSKMPEVTKDTEQPSTKNIQPPVAQTQVLIDEPVVDLKPKPTIPYPSRANKQKLPTTLVNEKCSAVILKKLPEKLGDPDKFLIPCDFPEFDECLPLADLAGIAEDVFVKVGKFHFLTDFVVVDYVVDPRVPLILGRPFLRTGRALIDVYGKKLTLRVDDEAITFKVGQTSKYSYNDAKLINRIDAIDVACEEYVQEVLWFSNKSKSGSPTPTSDPIISSSSPSLTPFEGSDFILEEIETFLQTPNEFSNLDYDYYDTEGDILYLEKLLNEDPSPNIPPVKTKDLKQVDATMTKPSIDEPPELELKELLSHLKYTFLEETDKLPVIISKELKDEEKSTLLKILKSYKREIAWKISNIKGIDPRFYTHKILMEDDFKLAVQHQRRVNPKIHEVIKKEVIKLLDAGLIYPISNIPWVSTVHYVPTKGGMTVVENEDNELIPTRHVPKVHDGYLLRYDRENNGGLYGRFFGLRRFFLFVPLPFRQNATK